LLQEDGFDHVIRAEKITGRYFSVFFVRNNCPNARLGIVASKKTLPSSVGRNRLKRVVREAFRHHAIRNSNLDIVVMARQRSHQESGERNEELARLFSTVESRCAEC